MIIGAGVSHSRPWLDVCDLEAVRAVLESGFLARGEAVRRFESALAGLSGTRGAMACASGTSALFLLLQAMDLGPEDEVVLPTYLCGQVLQAVLAAGARPVLCDVGPRWCPTPDTVRPHLSDRTAGVICPHLYGIPADAEGIAALGVPVIEDYCQAVGLLGPARRVVGRAAFFSFQATKEMTTAEGGLVATSDPDLLEFLHGDQGQGVRPEPRLFSPLSDLQAALGLSQLEKLPQFTARRRELAAGYCRDLADLPVGLPGELCGVSAFFRFPVRLFGQDPEDLIRAFAARGVCVRRGVDALLHRVLGQDSGGFPGAEELFATTLCLPVHPGLSQSERERVVAACQEVLGR